MYVISTTRYTALSIAAHADDRGTFGAPVTRAPSPFLSNSRVSLGEAIARELEREITSGTLAPGQRLGTKEELRTRFGVALATINEAIRLLEMRGMLSARPGPGGGIFVSQATTRVQLNQFVMGYRWGEATVTDHYAVRNALEPLVCREAAEYHRDADIRVLKQILDTMERHMDDPIAYLQRTWALHRRIAKICRNMPLRSIYLTLIGFLEDAVERAEIDPFNAIEHLARHRDLVDGIDSGPGKRLEDAIRAHEIKVVR
jgi:DNA-binding FadR family transcriptional regulator